ncbi:MAG: response regulator [Bryobacteraceae bacterium]
MSSEHRYRILYIEDNPADIRLLQEAISQNSSEIELQPVESGEEALKRLQTSERPHLVLLSWRLPAMGGAEVLRELKRSPELRAIPVVVLSSKLSDVEVEQIYSSHANCVIEKPLLLEAFTESIERIRSFWTGVTTLPNWDGSREDSGRTALL